jgi:hypothetical protein
MGSMSALGSEVLPEGPEVCCIACGRALYFFPDFYPLAFYCIGGHFQTIDDLLDETPSAGNSPRHSALEYWKKKALVLHDLSRRALAGGHALVAADLQEAADRVDGWGSNLEKLLAGSASK